MSESLLAGSTLTADTTLSGMFSNVCSPHSNRDSLSLKSEIDHPR